jgi:hypothetical protein
MIPIHAKWPGCQLPELEPGKVRYVLARDGVYFERRTEQFASSTLSSGPFMELDEHGEQCVLSCGTIPRTMIRSMLAFFGAAYARYEGEAALILLYHAGARHFRWHCPHQTVEVYGSLGRLRARDTIRFENPVTLPDGYIPFGDAHSHGNWDAIPSGIDRREEAYTDGLHIIVGNLLRTPTYHIDFMIDGRRFNLPPKLILADTQCEPFSYVPDCWIERIHMKPVSYRSYDSVQQARTNPSSGYSDQSRYGTGESSTFMRNDRGGTRR